MRDTLLQLVRLGLNLGGELPNITDWQSLYTEASRQGLLEIAFDGYSRLFEKGKAPELPSALKQRWIAAVLDSEQHYARQQAAAESYAEQLGQNAVRTYVLKGLVVSECYPVPSHRRSVDMDCFLLPAECDADVWEKGNAVPESAGYKVERKYYKNSTIFWPGLTIENHRFMTPCRGNRTLVRLERELQRMLRLDAGDDYIEGSSLLRPSVMVSALFLIEHAYSHFLHEGLIWRHVLDWMMFSSRHQDEIDWAQLNRWIDEFGFRRFYDSYVQLGAFLFGEVDKADLSPSDKMMLEDIWASLDLHESVTGVKGKFALAGNTWRARWKYRHFSELDWFQALCIQATGVLFNSSPKL